MLPAMERVLEALVELPAQQCYADGLMLALFGLQACEEHPRQDVCKPIVAERHDCGVLGQQLANHRNELGREHGPAVGCSELSLAVRLVHVLQVTTPHRTETHGD